MKTVTVNAAALREVLMALNGHGHLIRELQVTRGPLFPDNSIDVLLNEYNAALTKSQEPQAAEPTQG